MVNGIQLEGAGQMELHVHQVQVDRRVQVHHQDHVVLQLHQDQVDQAVL